MTEEQESKVRTAKSHLYQAIALLDQGSVVQGGFHLGKAWLHLHDVTPPKEISFEEEKE